MKLSLKISSVLLLLCLTNSAIASVSDTIIVNSYSKITQVFDVNQFDEDSVRVSDASLFKAGDTILIHQVKGSNWSYNFNSFQGYGRIGHFEYHIIKKKVGDIIVMRGKIGKKGTLSFDPSLTLQLIKVASFEKKIKVTKTITAKAWDGEKGGVIAIIADTLDLAANINATGKGFRGGNPTADNATGICFLSDTTDLEKDHYSIGSKDSSGFKGETVYELDNNHKRGRLGVASAGGGGNGNMSGGGGGSNYNKGGIGGYEAKTCSTERVDMVGAGGYAMNNSIYTTTDALAIFGGGGGSGVQVAGFKSAMGGNGGGAIIIMANVIKGNGFSIMSNGQSVTDTCTGAGGGGGGGGAIVADVNSYIGTVSFQVKGGTGGSTSNSNSGGPGGGGGGGYVYYNGTTIDATVITTLGLKGNSYWGERGATSGQPGGSKKNLLMPVNEFLFNIMPANQFICEGDTPKRIDASIPKGGTGTYQYFWLRSLNGTKWDTVSTTMLFQPPALFTTTFYRRVVNSLNGGNTILVTDTSTVDTIKVLPRINNNAIFTDTTIICFGQKMPLIHGTKVNGGNSTYTYQWQHDSISWRNVPKAGLDSIYKPTFTDTVLLHRVVKSAVCTSISNAIKIIVLDTIQNNIISQTQWVSEGVTAKPLKGNSLKGGDNTYLYSWEQSANKSTWLPAAIKFDTSGYKVPYLPDTLFYRRIVFSGDKKICKSISNVVTVHVLDSIENNIITGTETICGKTAPRNIKGTKSRGGDNSYSYQWLKSTNTTQWDSVTTFAADTVYKPGILLETTYFKRIVLSGPGNCSRDTSNFIKITVRPFIKNNSLLLKTDTICYGQTVDTLKATSPVDGDGAYSYVWEWSENTVNWDTVPGVALNTTYKLPNLLTSKYVRRLVKSGVCLNYSDTLHLIVLPAITNNTLASEVYVCKGSVPDIFSGGLPAGGNGKYEYKWLFMKDNQWISAIGKNDSIHHQTSATLDETQFKRVVYSGHLKCCTDTSKTLTLKIHELPTASFDLDSGKVCLGSTYSLPVTLTGKTDYTIKITDGNTEKTFSSLNSNSVLLDVKPLKSIGYTYNVTSLIDGNKCVALPITDKQYLQVYTVPVAKAGKDTSVCGLVVSLQATPSIGIGRWSASVEAQFTGNSNQFNATGTVNEYGTHQFTWTENNGGCASSETINITFYEQPINPIAGDDIAAPYLFKTHLTGKAPDLSFGVWSSPDASIIIDSVNSPTSLVEGLKFGENKFIWSVKNGVCKELSDTVVLTNLDLVIPNCFSPNGDQYNQTFRIVGLESQSGAELIIMNKWRAIVYHSKDYKNDWDGTYKSSNLPEDTYYYILHIIGRTYKGFVVIKR